MPKPGELTPEEQAVLGRGVAPDMGKYDFYRDEIGGALDPVGWANAKSNYEAGRLSNPGVRLGAQNAALQSAFMPLAQRPLTTNPYQAVIADQTRAAQLALMQQMEAQRQGPSLAAMQGQGAMGASTQQALAAGALGQGRNAMLGSRMASSGLASDVARARMMEDLKVRAGIGGVAGALRGQDIQSAEQQQRAGLAAQGMSDEMTRFYASQGASLDTAARNAALEDYKLRKRLEQQNLQTGQTKNGNLIQGFGTMLGMAL